MPIPLTYANVMAASQDAGNRSMRRAGRSSWEVDDWNVAAEICAMLMPAVQAKEAHAPEPSKPKPRQ